MIAKAETDSMELRKSIESANTEKERLAETLRSTVERLQDADERCRVLQTELDAAKQVDRVHDDVGEKFGRKTIAFS